jgi:hypothetical protein
MASLARRPLHEPWRFRTWPAATAFSIAYCASITRPSFLRGAEMDDTPEVPLDKPAPQELPECSKLVEQARVGLERSRELTKRLDHLLTQAGLNRPADEAK